MAVAGAGCSIAWAATINVGPAVPRSDDNGETPPVYVIRSRPNAMSGSAFTTVAIASRT
jgi:hypothetical protein